MIATASVSVVLPVRDGMPFLPAAIASVRAQTHRDWELLVVDDGSTDGTAAYLAGIDEPRLTVIASPGRGLAAALNAGVSAARGRYVARHDADDRSHATRFERQVAFLDAHPHVAVVGTCACYIDDEDQPVDDAWTRAVRAQQDPAQSPADIRALMPLTCCLTHGSIMARAHVLREHGGYDPAAVPAEDYDLWLRLLPERQLAKLPDRLYDYRIHGGQSGLARRDEQTARVIAAKLRFLRRQAPDLPARARLALPCADRGAALFRRVGPSEGFLALDGSGDDAAGADVVAITDFAALPAFAASLGRSGTYLQFGNLFVRRGQGGR